MLAERFVQLYHAQELSASPEIFLAGVVEVFCNYPLPVVARGKPRFRHPAKAQVPASAV